LEASLQFSFLQDRIVSPTPNPHPGGPGLCIYIPPETVATHFSRLLRHAWVIIRMMKSRSNTHRRDGKCLQNSDRKS
jgi:hypothetical protein